MITVTWCNNQVKSSNIFFLNFEYMCNSFAIVNFFIIKINLKKINKI